MKNNELMSEPKKTDIIDTHIHLTYPAFDAKDPYPYVALEDGELVVKSGDRKMMIREMKNAGVTHCIEPAIDYASNFKILDFCKKHRGFIHPAVGVHPSRTPRTDWELRHKIRRLAEDNEIVAIGETGLDFYSDKKMESLDIQKQWFEFQLTLAHELKLPVIYHVREAHEPAMQVLSEQADILHGGVLHCFSGGADEAVKYTTDFGLCIGVGGAIISERKGVKELEEAVCATPLESILLETDGPYVKPACPENIDPDEWKEARNSSLILPLVAERIAQLKDTTLKEVIRVTTENARRIFNLEK